MRQALVCALLASVSARAAVAVLPFKGPHASAAHDAVVSALGAEPKLHLVSGPEVERALRGAHPSLPEQRAALAKAVGADVLVEGTVRKAERAIEVHIVEGASGEVVRSLRLRAATARFDRLESAAKLLAALAPPETKPDVPVAEAPPPAVHALPAPAPAPVVATDPENEEASRPSELVAKAPSAEGKHDASVPAIDLAVGGGVQRRSFNYTDDLFHALDPYDLNGGASVEADLEAYPLAFVTQGLLANVGVTGRYETQPGLVSVDAAGDRLHTISDAWEVGPKVRLPFGKSEVSISGAYARQRFSFQLPPGLASAPVIPGVGYTAVRAGAGTRIALIDRVAVFADASYLDVLSTGEVGSSAYFPRLSVAGVEGRLGAAIAIASVFEARVWADYRRYFYSMNPQPGDPYVAGGALDEYLTVTAAVAVRF